jgi:hypothetical protein
MEKLNLTGLSEASFSLEDIIRRGRSDEIDLKKLAMVLQAIQDKINELVEIVKG